MKEKYKISCKNSNGWGTMKNQTALQNNYL